MAVGIAQRPKDIEPSHSEDLFLFQRVLLPAPVWTRIEPPQYGQSMSVWLRNSAVRLFRHVRILSQLLFGSLGASVRTNGKTNDSQDGFSLNFIFEKFRKTVEPFKFSFILDIFNDESI